ncbi:hypothetical protein QBC33DRAFT_600982, partial [Phialemonium atrogriseum]
MATLPDGWDFDYDGSRWFYRYKPSGVTQYTFPQPGDEYPEFVETLASRLAPEEKLESQQQVKRRSTTLSVRGAAHAPRRGADGPASAAARVLGPDPDDWFRPESFMFLGPGSYNDVSPMQEEEEEDIGRGLGGGEVAGRTEEGNREVENNAVAGATDTDGLAGTGGAQVSPVVSAEATPQVSESRPPVTARTAVPEPMITPSAPRVDASTASTQIFIPGDTAAAMTPAAPLINSRAVPQTFSPVGFMAELESDATLLCGEERNPAPVELASNDMMMMAEPLGTTPQTINDSVFQMEPAELPAQTSPVEWRVETAPAEQKVLGFYHEGPAAQTHAQQPAQSQAHYQQQLPQQHPHPEAGPSQPVNGSGQTFKITRKPTVNGARPGQYQAFTPGQHIASGSSRRTSLVLGAHSITQTQDTELGIANKRHSLAGPVLSTLGSSEIPAALQPPHIPHPAAGLSQTPHPRPLVPGSVARHDSIPIPPGQQILAAGQAHPSGLSHFPSVLRPAPGRPTGTLAQAGAPVPQQPPAPHFYMAYNP